MKGEINKSAKKVKKYTCKRAPILIKYIMLSGWHLILKGSAVFEHKEERQRVFLHEGA